MTTKELKAHAEGLTEDLREILGRPNFRCGNIARVLRLKGFECKRKVEEEQALVIFIMMRFNEKYGKDWKIEFDKYLNTKETPNPKT
jgi:hypothetical protein